MIPKGTVFHGPDGMGYEMTRDVEWGEVIKREDLSPVGGAPEPENERSPPLWFFSAMMEFEHEQSQKD